MSFNFIKKNIITISLLIAVIFINIVLTQFPLFNILSFEASFINAIVFSIVSGIYWLNSKNKNYGVKQNLFFYSSIILIPFITLSISTLFCKNCPLDDGIFFYLIISLPSIIVGSAIAEFSNFISYKFKYVLFAIVLLIVLLGFLPELYYNPQIYFYNPIFGYYPGVIYDELIEVNFKLFLYRSLNVFFSLIVILVLIKIKYLRKTLQLIVLSVIIIIYLISGNLKVYFNFASDEDKIIRNLNGVFENEFIKIVYPQSLTEREIKILLIEHFNAMREIEEQLETKFDKKITSFVFTSGAQKKELFGSANADVAKPWLMQIYLNYNNYQSSLKHELVHLISSKYATGLFKISGNFNPAMIEGYAMAIENNYDEYDIDYLAYLAFQNNYKVSLQKLFNNFGFFSNVSSLSYIYSGSFIKYLGENYNWSNVNNVYSSMNFEKEFGLNLNLLEKNYYNYLLKLPVHDNKNKANFYFGRVPLFKKYCARATAKELKKAQLLFSEKNYSEASILFEKIYFYSKSYSSFFGLIQSYIKLNKFDESLNLIKNIKNNFSNSAYEYSLELLEADINILSKRYKVSQKNYINIISKNPHTSYFNNAFIKLLLLERNDSLIETYILENDQRQEIIFQNLSEKPSDSALQLFLSNLNYNEIEYPRVREELVRLSKNFGLSSDTNFELCKFSYSFQDFDLAKHYGKIALMDSNFEKRKIIQSFLDKIDFAQNIFDEIGL